MAIAAGNNKFIYNLLFKIIKIDLLHLFLNT